MSLQMMRGTLVFIVAAAYVVMNEGLMILLIPPTRSGLPIGRAGSGARSRSPSFSRSGICLGSFKSPRSWL